MAVPKLNTTGGGPSATNDASGSGVRRPAASSNSTNPAWRNAGPPSGTGPNQSGNRPITRCGDGDHFVRIRLTGGSLTAPRNSLTAGAIKGSVTHFSASQYASRIRGRGSHVRLVPFEATGGSLALQQPIGWRWAVA